MCRPASATSATASHRWTARGPCSVMNRASRGKSGSRRRWLGTAADCRRPAPRPFRCPHSRVRLRCPASDQVEQGHSMQTTTNTDYRTDLENLLGLRGVTYRYGLSKEELFEAAVTNDRGRVRKGGGFDEPKAFPTKLGVQGPLVYYSDPDCTGRPVKDTFSVAWPEIEGEVWWKADMQKFDPTKFTALLKRVVEHL